MIGLDLLLRLIHIIAAMTLVGGAILMRCAYQPAIAENAASEFAAGFRRRWAKLVMISSGFLLISGVVNLVLIIKAYELPGQYHMVFGIKFLLVFVVMFLSAALSGRSGLAEKLRQKERGWLTINMILAIVVVCLAGLMKTTERTPKTSQASHSESVFADSATRS